MITYVMPIFVKGQFVAVAGVDIDFNVLCNVVGAMKAYQDGYGFLFKDGQTVYFHPDGKGIEPDFKPDFMILQNGDLLQRSATEQKLIHYEYKGIPMALAFTTFRNGMKLAITIVVGLGSTILAVKAADRIVRPLQDISAAARRLGRGEYDQHLTYTGHDEIGSLASHMNDTMERMS